MFKPVNSRNPSKHPTAKYCGYIPSIPLLLYHLQSIQPAHPCSIRLLIHASIQYLAAKSQFAYPHRYLITPQKKWRKLVAKSSVVPQWPSRLRDWWWWWWPDHPSMQASGIIKSPESIRPHNSDSEGNLYKNQFLSTPTVQELNDPQKLPVIISYPMTSFNAQHLDWSLGELNTMLYVNEHMSKLPS